MKKLLLILLIFIISCKALIELNYSWFFNYIQGIISDILESIDDGNELKVSNNFHNFLYNYLLLKFKIRISIK